MSKAKMNSILQVLNQDFYSLSDICQLLSAQEDERLLLFRKSDETRRSNLGNKVYFRGLIEFSNLCTKECYYCGIRHSNHHIKRYLLSDEEVLDAARFAWESRYGSIVLQAGENTSDPFIERITRLVKEIKALSNNELGITLSLGEQSKETYQQWYDAGAHRYLLRIETSNPELYRKIHPEDHLYSKRIEAIRALKAIGYQIGTGVMIGLPFQTIEDLANDLIFFKEMDVDMVGMGPYIEHEETPLYAYRHELLPIQERFELSLKMIATLRLMMPTINIAAATALQAIDPLGREKGIRAGANIIMPNITPGLYRNDYALYQNKPCVDEEPAQCKGCLDARIALADSEIGYGEWGDSKHFKDKSNK